MLFSFYSLEIAVIQYWTFSRVRLLTDLVQNPVYRGQSYYFIYLSLHVRDALCVHLQCVVPLVCQIYRHRKTVLLLRGDDYITHL